MVGLVCVLGFCLIGLVICGCVGVVGVIIFVLFGGVNLNRDEVGCEKLIELNLMEKVLVF